MRWNEHNALFPAGTKFLGTIDDADYWLSADGDRLSEVFGCDAGDIWTKDLFHGNGFTTHDRIAMHFGVEFSPATEARMVEMVFRDWMEKTRAPAFIGSNLGSPLNRLGKGNLWTRIRDTPTPSLR